MRATEEMLRDHNEKLNDALGSLVDVAATRMIERDVLLAALRLLVADVRGISNIPPQLFVALAKADEALEMCSGGAKEASSE